MKGKIVTLATWIIVAVLVTAGVVWLALSAYVMWVTRD